MCYKQVDKFFFASHSGQIKDENCQAILAKATQKQKEKHIDTQ